MLPALMDDLRISGIDVSRGIPLGVTRDQNNDAVLYFKGTDNEPEYLMNVDTLIGKPLSWEEIRDDFVGLNEETEYFYSFEWDTTKAGFVDIKNPRTGFSRYYYTEHRPTDEVNWYRKIEAETKRGVMLAIWEKFEKKYNVSSSKQHVIDVRNENLIKEKD